MFLNPNDLNVIESQPFSHQTVKGNKRIPSTALYLEEMPSVFVCCHSLCSCTKLEYIFLINVTLTARKILN